MISQATKFNGAATKKLPASVISPASALRSISLAWITIGLSVVAVVLHLAGSLSTTLQYASGDGCGWQLLSCHLTHWNFDQLFWDVAAFFALGVVCERADRRSFVLALVGSAVAIPLITTICYPQISTYRGLSGIDSALFTLLACQLAAWGMTSEDRGLLVAGMLAWLIFLVKTGFETITQGTLFVAPSSDFVSLPIAHLAGAVAGTLAWLIAAPSRGDRSKANEQFC
jgi:rhomboid family GlyGly-CTERM serine protease